jgi:Papain-like cysteine protease AvrRpt2
MLIPRSGQLGNVFRILGKAYSTHDHRGDSAADFCYEVPLVGQNHGNLCGDACVTMLSRWSRIALPGTSNLKIHALDFKDVTEFFKAVKRYKSLSKDKMRDECVKIFNKYLNGDTPSNILRVCNIETRSISFIELRDNVKDCVDKKTQRDNEFSGFANRWRRHTTKEQGYVVDETVFDMLLEDINEEFYHSNSVAELINNPRATPLSGLLPNDIENAYGYFLERIVCPANTRFQELFEFMIEIGPLMCCLLHQHPMYEQFPMTRKIRISHFIVVTGMILGSQTLIYNDPWKGANIRMSFQDFIRANDVNTIFHVRNPTPQMLARKR